jgi:hypothetical protein
MIQSNSNSNENSRLNENPVTNTSVVFCVPKRNHNILLILYLELEILKRKTKEMTINAFNEHNNKLFQYLLCFS